MQYVATHRDFQLHFAMVRDQLIIRRSGADCEEEYIPPQELRRDFPHVLISEHQHWYVERQASKIIQFRPNDARWNLHTKGDWSILLNQSHNSVSGSMDRKTALGEAFLADPSSALSRIFQKAIYPIEHDILHTMVVSTKDANDQPVLSLRLTRHGLDFTLNARGQLESGSFLCYTLDSEQDVGALYGLTDYMVLRDHSGGQRSRKVIIPRGKPTLGGIKHHHPCVGIVPEGGTYTYEVDDLVGRLQGNGSPECILYLAELHALTASHCVDPLTGRTGTAEALDLVQRGAVYSHHDISASWRQQVVRLADISPRREYSPAWSKGMQRVRWSPLLPTASQHPSFAPLMEALLYHYSERNILKSEVIAARTGTLGLEKSHPGMEFLSKRTAQRDSRRLSNEIPHKVEDMRAFDHTTRDSLQDATSQERELVACQYATSLYGYSNEIQVCSSLSTVAKTWDTILAPQGWRSDEAVEWFNSSIKDLWCTLYEMCRKRPRENRYGLALIFSLLAYRDKVPRDMLGALICTLHSSNASETRFVAPASSNLLMERGWTFEEAKLRPLIAGRQIGFDNSPEYRITNNNAPGIDNEAKYRWKERQYEEKLAQEVSQVLDALRSWWSDARMPLSNILIPSKPRLQDLTGVIYSTIKPIIEHWDRNRLFLDYLQQVNQFVLPMASETPERLLYEPDLPSIPSSPSRHTIFSLEHLLGERDPGVFYNERTQAPLTPIHVSLTAHQERLQSLRQFKHHLDPLLTRDIEAKYLVDLEESIEAFSRAKAAKEYRLPTSTNVLSVVASRQRDRLGKLHRELVRCLQAESNTDRMLFDTCLWPTVTRVSLLQRLSLHKRPSTPPEWLEVIGTYAIQIVEAQTGRRLLYYAISKMSLEFNREVAHVRTPDDLENLDWLLIEIEADMGIRREQVEVTLAMMDPEDGNNAVRQLNMGEGKSSVIVPIAAASLADTTRLVRVVVLKPQMKLQLDLLRRRIGGLANRRVETLPFSRDVPVEQATVDAISRIMTKCEGDGGILLCQPEHILSFKLLGLDASMANINASTGEGLIKLQLRTLERTRDILDESDEILHTRHQLIYTVGVHKPLDCAPLRWELVQELLHVLQLSPSNPRFQSFSQHFVNSTSDDPGSFPEIRMLGNVESQLSEFLAQRFVFEKASPLLKTANFPNNMKVAALVFVEQRDIAGNMEMIQKLESYCKASGEEAIWSTLLLLRGMLAFGVLAHALRHKRWRVDYGLALGMRDTRLAVPYRAKDSPSLRSDFAHPDIVVLLTCLTYYYDGLDDNMIVQAYKELLKCDNPEMIYEEWIAPYGKKVPPSLSKLSGINADNDQRIMETLRPFIRLNKRAIDFYLNKCVFPREAKEFPQKMSTSGWDLAIKKTHPTTGFSGTNDSRFLLPVSIAQQNPEAQRHTAATVLSFLLQGENSVVVTYENNLSSDGILDKIMKFNPRPQVLLDVGAQILDRSNQELARAWLKRCEDGGKFKAIVFFDDKDNLSIMESDGSWRRFADSPYSSRLDECLVYLDDAHTRGTDLKLPKCRAAVTLGPRLVRDKLVQGCMRMRKLGTDHSIIFLAPEEVSQSIQKSRAADTAQPISTRDVLAWTMKETCLQIQGNASNWVVQGYEFARRQHAWNSLKDRIPGGDVLRGLFCQKEGRSLAELYGPEATSRRQSQQNQDIPEDDPVINALEQQRKLFSKISLEDAGVQEEQEVELAHEKEVERQVERPPPASPAKHRLHPELEQIVLTGRLPSPCNAICTIQKSLEQTSVSNLPRGGNAVFADIYVTEDFCKTIQRTGMFSSGMLDDFLRPVEWVVTSRVSGECFLLILGPFEANLLLPVFRRSTKSRLHLFSARTTMKMQTLEELKTFTVPNDGLILPQLKDRSGKLNLYSGSLYLHDMSSYQQLCKVLGLVFEAAEIEKLQEGTVNTNGFVKNTHARSQLRLDFVRGFTDDPVQFLRRLFFIRRYGRSFLQSHMGKVLFGLGLENDPSAFPDASELVSWSSNFGPKALRLPNSENRPFGCVGQASELWAAGQLSAVTRACFVLSLEFSSTSSRTGKQRSKAVVSNSQAVCVHRCSLRRQPATGTSSTSTLSGALSLSLWAAPATFSAPLAPTIIPPPPPVISLASTSTITPTTATTNNQEIPKKISKRITRTLSVCLDHTSEINSNRTPLSFADPIPSSSLSSSRQAKASSSKADSMPRSRSGSFYCPIESSWAPLSIAQKAIISTAPSPTASPQRRHVRTTSLHEDPLHLKSKKASLAAPLPPLPAAPPAPSLRPPLPTFSLASLYGFGANANPPMSSSRKTHAHSPSRPSPLRSATTVESTPPLCPSAMWLAQYRSTHYAPQRRARSGPTASSLLKSVLKSSFMTGPMAQKARMYGLRVAWCVFGDARVEMARDIFGRSGNSMSGIVGDDDMDAEIHYEETVEIPMSDIAFDWEFESPRQPPSPPKPQPRSFLSVDEERGDPASIIDTDLDSDSDSDYDSLTDEEGDTESADSDELDDEDEIRQNALALFQQPSFATGADAKNTSPLDNAHWEVISYDP